MSSRYRLLAIGAYMLSASLLAGCSGDGVSPPESYRVGGTVSGLQSGNVVLRNNGSDEVALATDGQFQFPTGLPAGSNYVVAISSQPPGQMCQVSNGAGTVGQSNVNDVVVACQAASYTVGGTVSGLDGGTLTLRNNGGDDLSVNANGGFTFATGLNSGSGYEVVVAAQPAGQVCAVSSGSGVVAGADITSVSVACVEDLFTVGGSVTGLAGGTVGLQNNGTDDLAVAQDGNFAFGTPLQDGAGYVVSVTSQPAGQLCTVAGGSGTVSGADVSDVVVSCADAYSVSGTVAGLSSGSVVLQNNGGDDLTLSQNGDFTFPTLVADGAAYSVAVSEQPDGLTCAAIGGVGAIAGADVAGIEVACAAQALSNQIVFHSDRDGDFEVFVMDPDGSNIVQLTDNDVDDYWPVVSPDGTLIAFWTGRDGNQEIYVMSATGLNQTRVTTNGAADRQPAWSPDGQRLAFHRVVSGNAEIFTIKLDGTGLIRLTNNAYEDGQPAWSPNGSLIAFTTDRDGNDEVYVMNASNGSNQRNISNNPGRDGTPDWSPDSSKLLFDRNNSSVDAGWLGDAEVMCMNADGSGQVRLTTDTAGIVDTQPRWSANGARLAFNSDRVAVGVNPEIYVGRTNNCTGISQLSRVTQSSAKDAAADWAPQ